MAKVELDERFTQVGERDVGIDADGDDQVPRGVPLIFDASAVVAIEAKGDGRFAMHLAGGQTIQLRAAVAAAVLRKLGVAAEVVKGRRQKAEGRKPRRPKAKQAPKPQGLASAAAAIAGFFS